MLTIRLIRTGKKNSPSFRIVLIEKRTAPQSGKFLEVLGSYDPQQNKNLILKEDRIKYWISQGSKASDTVHNLLVKAGLIDGPKIKKSAFKKKNSKEETKEIGEQAASGEDTAEKPAESSSVDDNIKSGEEIVDK